MERMMKLQDVLLKAVAQKINFQEAADIIGDCGRTMRRLREEYQKFGYTLRDEHQIGMSYAWVQLALQRTGLACLSQLGMLGAGKSFRTIRGI